MNTRGRAVAAGVVSLLGTVVLVSLIPDNWVGLAVFGVLGCLFVAGFVLRTRRRRALVAAVTDPAATGQLQRSPKDGLRRQVPDPIVLGLDSLVVRRGRSGAGWARRVKVTLDGEAVARLPMGGSAEISVQPGGHVLEARCDWWSSPPLVVQVDPQARPVRGEIEVNVPYSAMFTGRLICDLVLVQEPEPERPAGTG